MNCAYRLIWNEDLNAWVVAPEIASARGKRGQVRRSAAALMLTLAIGAHTALAADLATTALPGGGQVSAGQATISSTGAAMTINQGSQRAIINWQNFDIGSQASVNFQQPNSAAVTLNRAGGPTASRIEGQLTANGQVFLINPNGVLFGSGARVNVGGLVASTLNIRDDDFLSGNYNFSGNGGSITNQGQITAAPGGYLAFIAPTITNSGTLSAPQGTVAMGAGERVRLNFAGDRLVGLDVSADTIDTLITNNQAIRAEGGAILLTAAGAESVTRSVINNTGVLEASSLTSDGGRIVLTAGNDINLGATSTVAVDGKKGGEITVQAKSGTLLADGSLSARGATGTGGSVQLLGHQVGLVNAALVDASGTTGGGTVLVGGDYQGKNPDVQNASRTYVSADATIKADALDQGDGGKVVVWADEITRYYGSISAKGGSQGGNGGFVEVSGKRDLEFLGAVDVAAPMGTGGRVLLDPQDIVLNTTTQAAPPNNPNGTPDVAFNDPPAAGTTTIQITDITGFSELYLQATNNITVGARIIMGANNSIRLEANNNITLVNGATAATRGSIATSGTGSITLKADADGSGSGNLVMNNATLTSNVGGIAISGASISGSGAITATGAASANGGNIGITGTSATGNINLTGAMTANGGTAAAGTPGRNAGNVTITGAGAVTTGAITANGSNGNGANQAGGNGGVISITSNGTLTTGNLGASGGNGGTGTGSIAAGGNAGTIAVTNNSTGIDTLTTGTLTARAGIARGAIVSGSAGSVTVSNKATTLLQTGAINTSGQAGGAGGNVALTSAGGVTVTSSIATGGGTLNATTSAAGRNAGNVTIKGVNRSIAAAITASGGAAIVAGQAGGAGGNVQVTGTDGTIATAGTLSTTGITARNGNAVGNVASGPAGSIALDATQITATGALNTTGGNNGAGGNIALTSTGTLNINGAIATSGGTANASSAGSNAGNITISGAGVTSTGTITASGSGATT
ncbi:MAG: filamentous hemagglutinin N-terminal domain-containing protein, partial [Azonexus sp.]